MPTLTLSRRADVDRPPPPTTDRATALARRLASRFGISRTERQGLDQLLSRSVRSIGDRVNLIEQGAVPGEIHVMLSGIACRWRSAGDGKRQMLALYLPGDVCDFDVFMMQAMDSTIQAIGPVQVAGISRDSLNEITRTYPKVGQGLWWSSLVNASIQREWMARIAGRAAAQRLAHLACELHTRMAMVGLTDRLELDLGMPQAELGAACGLTTEHTNRTLRSLRTDGLMSFDRRRLSILDPQRLVALAGFDPAFLHAGDIGHPLPLPARAVPLSPDVPAAPLGPMPG